MRYLTHKKLILGISILILFLLGSMLWNFSESRHTIQKIPIHAIVGTYAGFRIDNSTLDFGTLLPGSFAEREIMLAADETMKVTLIVKGISFVAPRVDVVFINAGSSQRVSFLASVPSNCTLGEYRGTLFIQSQKI